MFFNTVLYALAIPFGLAVLWWSLRRSKGIPATSIVWVPSLALLIGYCGLRGRPGWITTQAFSGIFYGTILILVYSTIVPRQQSLGWITGFARISLTALLFCLTFYPRYPVAESPLSEAILGCSLSIVALTIWMLQDSLADEEVFHLTYFGLYCLGIGTFTGIYSSLILGQVTVSVALAFLVLAGIAFVKQDQFTGTESIVFRASFPIVLLLYTLFFTTLSPSTIFVLILGSGIPVLGRLSVFQDRLILRRIIILIGLVISLSVGIAIEESYFELEENTSSYRPYS